MNTSSIPTPPAARPHAGAQGLAAATPELRERVFARAAGIQVPGRIRSRAICDDLVRVWAREPEPWPARLLRRGPARLHAFDLRRAAAVSDDAVLRACAAVGYCETWPMSGRRTLTWAWRALAELPGTVTEVPRALFADAWRALDE